MSHLSAGACMLAVILMIDAASKVLMCAYIGCRVLGAHVKLKFFILCLNMSKKLPLTLIGAPCSPWKRLTVVVCL